MEADKLEKAVPISIEIIDGDCLLKLNGRSVGFCKKIKFEADTENKLIKLEIERVVVTPWGSISEEIEKVRDNVNYLKLTQEYYPYIDPNK